MQAWKTCEWPRVQMCVQALSFVNYDGDYDINSDGDVDNFFFRAAVFKILARTLKETDLQNLIY